MRSKIAHNTNLIFRWIIFLAFIGHGLVNLGLSPSISLHINLVKSIFPDSVDAQKSLYFFAAIDFVLGFLVLARVWPKPVIRLAIAYLLSIAIAAWSFYFRTENSVFGIAEIMRRLPWVFFLLFLYFDQVHNVARFRYLRIGLAFAFLAHGVSSLGFLGINEGHIELASQIVPEDYVRDFVFCTGLSDTLLGLLLLFGVFSRSAAVIGTFWLVFVIGVSFTFAIPDGIFRLGFLLSCIYVALDKRCHLRNIRTLFHF
jgi:uncharacterized membrane protein YphA (DoxX/SURF4 family)